MTAEPERITHGPANPHIPGLVGHVVQVALRIGIVEVDGRGNGSMVHAHDCSHQFHAATGTEEMTDGGFGAADGEFASMSAEHILDRSGLRNITEGSAGSVGIDIVELVGAYPGV